MQYNNRISKTNNIIISQILQPESKADTCSPLTKGLPQNCVLNNLLSLQKLVDVIYICFIIIHFKCLYKSRVYLLQLNIGKVLESTVHASKSDPAAVANDSSSSLASHIEHILSKVHWDAQDQLPQLSLDDLDAFDQYLLGATALDVSIMITFQVIPTAAADIPSTKGDLGQNR